MFERLVAFVIKQGANFALGIIALSVLANLWTAWNTGREAALQEFKDAATGTNNSKCEGHRTAEQEKLCTKYEETLAKYWLMLVLKKTVDRIPTCGVMSCNEIYVGVRDSPTALILWGISMVAILVIVIRFVNFLWRFCERDLNGERMHATEAYQQTLHSHIRPDWRHLVDMSSPFSAPYGGGPTVTPFDSMMMSQDAMRQRLAPPPLPSRQLQPALVATASSVSEEVLA
jgi:hypothetical protein